MDKLDEKQFVRHRLFGDKNHAKWQQYASFVIGENKFSSLLDYEFRILFFGGIPGALGLFLRQKFYKKLFKKVGRNVLFGKNVTIRHADKIILGDNVVLDDNCLIDGRGAGAEGLEIGDNTIIGRSSIVQSKVGPIKIGENVNIGSSSAIISQGGISVGDWVQIGGGCTFSGGRFKLDLSNMDSKPFQRFSMGPIEIGAYCFIGGSVQITDGIRVGRQSVIGAGSVVMKNLPDDTVYMPKPGMVWKKSEEEK